MERETVEYRGHGLDVKLTIAVASNLIGVRRARLQVEGMQADEKDLDRHILRVFSYPDLIAAVVEQAGFPAWPVSFEQFLELPEELTITWEAAVYRLNPHWQPQASNPEEKKAVPMTSTAGSTSG